MKPDLDKASRAIADFLSALGHDPAHNPHLHGTPERVAVAFHEELLRGYQVDIDGLLADSLTPNELDPSPVVVRNIRVTTTCPHHLMPALGEASIGYLPGRSLLGIGVLPRLIHAYAERFTLQEEIGQNVVTSLVTQAGARAAICKLTMRHSCLSARGSREHHAEILTLAEFGPEHEKQRLRQAGLV